MLQLFKPERHFEADPRLIFVEDIAELKKLRRFFNKVSGVLLPYDPFNAQEMHEIVQFARSKTSVENPRYEAAIVRSGHDFRNKAFGDGYWHYPRSLDRVFNALLSAYDNAIGGMPEDMKFRVNVHLPEDDTHKHRGITYALTGDGTLAKNANGVFYNFPGRHIAAFGNDVDHMAPQDRSTYDDPRISFALGEP